MTLLGFVGLLLGLILLATCVMVLYSLFEVVWTTHSVEGRAAGAWVVGFVFLIAGAVVYRSESRLALRGVDPSEPYSVWVNWDAFLLLALGVSAFVVGILVNIRAFDIGNDPSMEGGQEEEQEAVDEENRGE